MQLREALSLPLSGKCVSLVGAGGKTSLLFQLAREFCEDGFKCVVLTSTHIYRPTPEQAVTITDCHPDAETALAIALLGKTPVAVGSLEASTGKLCIPPGDLLTATWEQADWILVEADGSHHFPIKVPAPHEPKIFEPSDSVIALAGLSALGKPLSQVCQRASLASALLGVTLETLVSPFILARILTSEYGQFKNVRNPTRFSVFLNQADNEKYCSLAKETSFYIKSFIPGCPVAAGSLRKGDIFLC